MIVYVRMNFLLRYPRAPNIAGLLIQADQELVASDEQIGVVERQSGGRPSRGVEMVDRECRAGGLTCRVEGLRPNTAIAVPGGHVVTQLSIGRPLRREYPRAPLGGA